MGPQPTYGYYGEQKKGFNWKVVAIIVGGFIFIIAAISVISILSKNNSIGTQSQHLSAQLGNLAILTQNATKKLDNDDLQKVNAETALINTGVQSDLASILPKKPDKSVVAAESDASTTSALANAALAGTYDSQYKTVLTQKLERLTALLSEMTSKTNSRTVKASLQTDYANYQAVLTNLEKIQV